MKVTVIGGGGAFNDHNSSFLIELEDKKLLFDCGLDAFRYCKKNDIEPDYVYISHLHFDHIGGLEQFVFYNYFMRNNSLNIAIVDALISDLAKILDNCQFILKNGKVEQVDNMLNFVRPSKMELGKRYSIETILLNHKIALNYGLIIKDNNEKKCLIITGDTKASKILKNKIIDIKQKGYEITIFHDFSFYNDPKNNVHCCAKDYNEVYGDLINSDIQWYLYHNQKFDDTFNGKIIEI